MQRIQYAWLLLLFVGLTGGNGWAESASPSAGASTLHLHEVTDSILPSGTFNVITYAAPRAIALKELGLKEAGVRGGPVFQASDELRIFASRTLMEQRPKARVWLNSREQAWWYHTGGNGSAEALVLQPGEVLVLVTKASTSAVAWKNPLR